jgi:SPP1 family phage portal protein
MTTGFITVTQLINAKIMADRVTLDSARLADLIRSDLASPAKQAMAEGTYYYNCRHDILNQKHLYVTAGVVQEDTTKANERIPHPFHQVLVDQKVSYVAGKPVVVTVSPPKPEGTNADPTDAAKSEAKEYQTALLKMLGEQFDDLVADWLKGSSNKGVEWIHFFVTPENTLDFCITPGEGIIPIYDTQYDRKLVALIRYYGIDYVNEKGDIERRYKAEWWDDKQVTYFMQNAERVFIHDPSYEANPGPHWFTWNDSMPSQKQNNQWGRIPFVPLPNNSEWHTDLRPVKPLIDAYDKVISGWVNDLMDFQEIIYVLKGYAPMPSVLKKEMSELDTFVKNLKAHKVISVEASEHAGVDTIQAVIPVEAKLRLLEITRKAIFYFGKGIDVDNEKFNAPSGVALKFLYANLDLKANRSIRKLKLALEEFMWFVTHWINMTDGTAFDFKLVKFSVNPSVIFNEKEKVDTLVASEGIISKKTILENHPYVDDVEEEQKRLDEDEQERVDKGMVDLEDVVPMDDEGNPIEPAPNVPMKKKNGRVPA